MIYFRFLSPHLEVNPAKKDSPELKLANRHSEIQSTKSTAGAFQTLILFQIKEK
jgi:hypothetical protein